MKFGADLRWGRGYPAFFPDFAARTRAAVRKPRRAVAERSGQQTCLVSVRKESSKNKDLRKQFFSEEKNQKTFVPAPAAPYWLRPAACQHRQPIRIKVFWFFSSEKNTLKPLTSLPCFSDGL
jgi:hypothetical protein